MMIGRAFFKQTLNRVLVATVLGSVGLVVLTPVQPSQAAEVPEPPSSKQSAQQPAERSLAERNLAERKDGHRVLRENVPATFSAPTEPSSFEGYAGAPEFSVVPRLGELRFYPCEGCHAALPVNRTPRRLLAPHPAALEHGKGRIWCLSCHSAEHRNELETLASERVSFDQADRVCGQCHSEQHRDWHHGAHGKRVANWQGERQIYSCTHCHDPHDPSIKARAPEPPPPVRRGLQQAAIGSHSGEQAP